MAIWWAKAVVQKALSGLPAPWRHPANELFQRYVTRGTQLSDRVLESRLATAGRHAAASALQGGGPVLELGSGWFPIVPVGLHLCGFGPITSVDITSHLTEARLVETVEGVLRLHREGRLEALLPDVDLGRLRALELALGEGALTWGSVQLTPRVGDARDLEDADGTFSLIVSNHVLEHLPRAEIPAILRELRRVLAPGGTQSHLVDLGDHFSHLDRRITPYNFLRFSERAWWLIDNRIQPQNRLRVDDYRALLAEAGWVITDEECESAGVDLIRPERLSREFAGRDPEVLAVTTYLVRATR